MKWGRVGKAKLTVEGDQVNAGDLRSKSCAGLERSDGELLDIGGSHTSASRRMIE